MLLGNKRSILFCSGFFSLPTNRELVRAATRNGWILNSFRYHQTEEATYTGGIAYDGVISHLHPGRTKMLSDHLGGIPHVTLNMETSQELGMPGVALDHIPAGRMVAQHFLELGFTHFAAIAHTVGNFTFERRAEGVSQVLTEAGFDPVEILYLPSRYHGDRMSEEEGYQDLLLSLPTPMALIPFNDRIANVLINTCRRVDLTIPSQVSICGFDNDPVACELAPIPLSSVDTRHAAQAALAAETLRRLLAGEAVSPETSLIEPRGVMVRSTSGLPAQASPTMAKALAFTHEAIDSPGLSVPDIARAAGVSRRTLYDTFQREMGTSPLKYLVRLRVNKAKDLIVGTKRKLKEIRAECGFSSDYQMYMAFKRCTGQSPGHWRQ